MQPAVAVAWIVLFGLIPGSLAGLAMLTINATGRIWMNVRIGAVMALLNIALDIIFISGYGAIGASIANTSSQTITTIVVIIVLQKMYGIQMPWKKLPLLAIVSIISTLAIPILKQSMLMVLGNLIAVITVSAFVYLAAIWKLGYLPFADLRHMARMPI